jgi:ABC-type branched-subunit amino acid transport system substrate-binding protein
MIVKRHRGKASKMTLAGLAGLSLLTLAACSSSSKPSSTAPTSSGSSPAGSTGGTLLAPLKVTGTISGPGVTATTITIGDIATVSGPVPGLFGGANDGLDAWAAYVNASGGIDGRQVKVVHLDDAFDCSTFTNDLNQLTSEAFAAVGTFSLEDTCGKSVLTAHPSFVYIPALMDVPLYSLPNAYTPQPAPPGSATTTFNYIKGLFPNDITHTGTISSGSETSIGKESQLTAESLGYKYVYARFFGPTETNFTSDILRMKADGVKIVDLLETDVAIDATFMQEAAQQNFHPDAIMSVAAYDASFLKLLGTPSLASNLYAPVYGPLWQGTDRATVPAVNTFDTWMAKAKPGTPLTLFAQEAWNSAELFLQAMHDAGSQVTQSSVLSAVGNIHNFDAQGLQAPSDPGNKMGTHCIVIAGIKNGQWVRINPSSGLDCNGVYHNVPLSEVGG